MFAATFINASCRNKSIRSFLWESGCISWVRVVFYAGSFHAANVSLRHWPEISFTYYSPCVSTFIGGLWWSDFKTDADLSPRTNFGCSGACSECQRSLTLPRLYGHFYGTVFNCFYVKDTFACLIEAAIKNCIVTLQHHLSLYQWESCKVQNHWKH